jgi:hypothetical protein
MATRAGWSQLDIVDQSRFAPTTPTVSLKFRSLVRQQQLAQLLLEPLRAPSRIGAFDPTHLYLAGKLNLAKDRIPAVTQALEADVAELLKFVVVHG